MSLPKVFIPFAPDEPAPASPNSTEAAWAWVGRFGLLLGLLGLVDTALLWLPPQVGNPDWEFQTVAVSFSRLPILSIGFAAYFASVLARRRRKALRLTCWGFLMLGFLIGTLQGVYVLEAIPALIEAPAEASLEMSKTVVRTSAFGTAFCLLYLSAAAAGQRHLRSIQEPVRR